MIKKESNLVFYFNFIAFSQFIIINKKNCNLIHKRFKILMTSTFWYKILLLVHVYTIVFIRDNKLQILKSNTVICDM